MLCVKPNPRKVRISKQGKFNLKHIKESLIMKQQGKVVQNQFKED